MLENPNFVYDKVLRASYACGPLFLWISSQISFTEILTRVQPLRDEVEKLALESQELTAQHERELEKIAELERSITVYKDEYAVLIRETEIIKTEMSSVKAKVERSTALLSSLSEEQSRWDGSRKCTHAF